MRKASLLALLVALILLWAVSPALARGHHRGHASAGVTHLVQKDPMTWDAIDSGAAGKLKYKLRGFELKVNFKGEKLTPSTDYTLIYYPDPWPGKGLICLGEGVADEAGNLKIKNRAPVTNLPLEGDANYPCGAKIWLVLTSDVDCEGRQMVGWHPEAYLFQTGLVNFAPVVAVEGPDAAQ